MSAVPAQKDGKDLASPASSRWIVNSWVDQTLIVFTPLFSAIVVFFLYSSWVGVTAETISLIVTSFFALGHHLPGMIRAYGDRDLFQRFRWRFILVPPVLFATFFPLYQYHFDAFRLITVVWATWHGLMQLYGFARIYDMKVGSRSVVTAYIDWLLCLSWFVTAQIMSPRMMTGILDHWYGIGGTLVSSFAVSLIQYGCLTISIALLIVFVVNSVLQSTQGAPPSPIKLLMLTTGIGFWWFAVVTVENLVLGIALFDISHDVQYMAITWLYNCRRVTSNPNIGKFISFVFRRGMVLLYVGLIVSYGAIGLVPSLVQDETIKTIFTGFLWTSTILHYYMDGFIWKVRESSTQSSLGLKTGANNSAQPPLGVSGLAHLLKWSPLLLFVSWLFLMDMDRSSISAARVKELNRLYTAELAVSNSLPQNPEEQNWIYTRFLQVQNVAAAMPNCQPVQTRAAIMLANFGRNDEAKAVLEKQIANAPNSASGYLLLGALQMKTSNWDAAQKLFEQALLHAVKNDERARANLGMGEVHLERKEFRLAEARFDDAVKCDPQLEPSVKNMLKKHGELRTTDKPSKSEGDGG